MRTGGGHHVDLVVSSMERSLLFRRTGYYAVFYDPADLKLEIVHRPERS